MGGKQTAATAQVVQLHPPERLQQAPFMMMKTAQDMLDTLAEDMTAENVEILEALVGLFKADLALLRTGIFPAEAIAS